MFVRVTGFQQSLDQVATLAASYRENALPTLSQQAGFRGAAVLVDRATGAGHTVSYWDSQESMQASEQVGASLRAQAAQGGTTVGEVDHLEIVIMERSPSGQAGPFVRTNELTAAPEKMDGLISFIRDQLALLRTQNGFRALIMAVNRQSGRVIVSSTWDTAADRDASDAAMKQPRQAASALAGAQNVSGTLYETVVLELKQAAQA